MSRKNRNMQKQEPEEQVLAAEEMPSEAEQAVEMPPEEKVDFDAWHVMRSKRIPKAHHKEIIKADFKGRGLGQRESLKDFDDALAKYGVKLA